ncbi:proteoglycan 4-like [Myiozetetes cayanensis]|uniref:proteoglycan 4-like n=1 Tax=Myiozetetes cayanensis TaxID=478635 RepID=UPI00215E6DE2|nr:proteoglycan 4-like [Myiozetetes cayanensis]
MPEVSLLVPMHRLPGEGTMEKRNTNPRPKEGHQLRDRAGGRGQRWDGAGRANTLPKQPPPFPSSRPHQRQPQDSQGQPLREDTLSSPYSTLSSRSTRSPSILAAGARGPGPQWCRTCPGRPLLPASSTAARSQRRRVKSCWACSGVAEPEPQQQDKDHGWPNEAPLVPQRCGHNISRIPVPAAAAGRSQASPANPPLPFHAYKAKSSPGPRREVSHCVKQETQPETPAQRADSAVPQHAEQETHPETPQQGVDSAVPQHAEQETQTEEQTSAAPLLVDRETQTETLAQEEEISSAPQLVDQETQIESPVPRSPSTLSSALSTTELCSAPGAARQRLPPLRRALGALRGALRCPCRGRPERGARRAPGDGCCSEPVQHPRGGTAGTGARAAPQAFPAAEDTEPPPYSWPWLIETSV